MAQGRTGARGWTARKARWALLWTLASFVAAQVFLTAALSVFPGMRDPEYGCRLSALRRRLAERAPGSPLVLFLGSSRTGVNVLPGLFAANKRMGAGPVIFNFGLCNSGPVQELMCLRRLLADGVRPHVLIIELRLDALSWKYGGDDHFFPPTRLTWRDVRVVARYCQNPWQLRQTWLCQQLAPWYEQRVRLLELEAPASWRGPNRAGTWEHLDPWGWLECRGYGVDSPEWRAVRRQETEHMRKHLAAGVVEIHVAPLTQHALAKMVDLCRQQNVQVAFLLPPDLSYQEYPAETSHRVDRCLHALGQDLGAAIIDARDWSALEDFHDGIHLTHAGAAAFTLRLERELEPCLAGEPFERRWPVGRAGKREDRRQTRQDAQDPR